MIKKEQHEQHLTCPADPEDESDSSGTDQEMTTTLPEEEGSNPDAVEGSRSPDDTHTDAAGGKASPVPRRGQRLSREGRLGRKSNKPMMEKKRRDRFNTALDQLKVLISQVSNTTHQFSKMEKADILEMAVKHVEQLHRRVQSNGTSTNDLSRYVEGFSECGSAVGLYLSHLGVPQTLVQQTTSHLLQHCRIMLQQAQLVQQQQLYQFHFHTQQLKELQERTGFPGRTSSNLPPVAFVPQAAGNVSAGAGLTAPLPVSTSRASSFMACSSSFHPVLPVCDGDNGGSVADVSPPRQTSYAPLDLSNAMSLPSSSPSSGTFLSTSAPPSMELAPSSVVSVSSSAILGSPSADLTSKSAKSVAFSSAPRSPVVELTVCSAKSVGPSAVPGSPSEALMSTSAKPEVVSGSPSAEFVFRSACFVTPEGLATDSLPSSRDITPPPPSRHRSNDLLSEATPTKAKLGLSYGTGNENDGISEGEAPDAGAKVVSEVNTECLYNVSSTSKPGSLSQLVNCISDTSDNEAKGTRQDNQLLDNLTVSRDLGFHNGSPTDKETGSDVKRATDHDTSNAYNCDVLQRFPDCVDASSRRSVSENSHSSQVSLNGMSRKDLSTKELLSKSMIPADKVSHCEDEEDCRPAQSGPTKEEYNSGLTDDDDDNDDEDVWRPW